MEKLIDRMSSYEVFNALIPGVLICLALDTVLEIPIFDQNWILSLAGCYIAGLVASRLGSFIVEPLFKKMKLITPEPYSEYVSAEQKDEGIKHRMAVANMYRTLLASLLCCAVVALLGLANIDIFSPVAIGGVIALCTLLFGAAYSKQYKYVAKRVRTVNGKEGKDVHH